MGNRSTAGERKRWSVVVVGMPFKIVIERAVVSLLIGEKKIAREGKGKEEGKRTDCEPS